MSIFNLFGEIAEPNGGQIKSMERSKTSHEIRLNSLKTMGETKLKGLSVRSNSDMNVSNIRLAEKSMHDKQQDCSMLKVTQASNAGCSISPGKQTPVKVIMEGTKPKGLSIRSNSDMNVSSVRLLEKNVHDKEQDCSKLKVTQMDNTGRPISPGKRTPVKKLTSQSSKLKEFALKEDTMINKCTKKQVNDGIFKKPLLPKKNIKRIPKPEKLTYWYDSQRDFDYGYIEAVEKEFKDLLSKEKENIKPCEKNVLMSDAENLLDIPKLSIDKSSNEEFLFSNLPEVSDISDNENLY